MWTSTSFKCFFRKITRFGLSKWIVIYLFWVSVVCIYPIVPLFALPIVLFVTLITFLIVTLVIAPSFMLIISPCCAYYYCAFHVYCLFTSHLLFFLFMLTNSPQNACYYSLFVRVIFLLHICCCSPFHICYYFFSSCLLFQILCEHISTHVKVHAQVLGY